MGRRKKKHNKFYNYMIFLVLIVSIITIGLIYFVNILPINYFAVFVSIIVFMNLIIIWMLKTKGAFKRFFGCIIAILFVAIEILGINYELNTLDFFKQFGFNNYKTEKYNVAVLMDSEYEKLKDLNKKDIAHLDELNRDGLKSFLKDIKNEIKYESVVGEDILQISNKLIDEKVDAIILEDAEIDMLKEDNYDIYENLRIIYSKKIEKKIKDITKNVDITKKPFNIYISGIDTYGSITKVSRSDVNIIATVNPVDNKILLTTIPHDYYVKLHSYKEYDKLTHAGIYGIEESVNTIEDLLDTNINYYLKVNFTSVIKIVDALGGVEVNSNYAFKSQDGYYYEKGLNKMDGKRALSFVRERKAFTGGDRTRGENQQLVLSAIINKAMSPKMIIKYNDLLNAVDDNFITNIDNKQITNFIKNEIKKSKSWEIESISLDGENSYDYTYSSKRSKLYVMQPNEKSISNAKEKINEVLNNVE